MSKLNFTLKPILLKNSILVLFAVVVFIACGNLTTNKEIESEMTAQKNGPDGEILLKANCYSCHNPSMKTGRIAPPMEYVKEHYIREAKTEEEFTTAISNFVKQPSKRNAKMHGAIANFGLMPPLSIDEEKLKRIARYIYNNNIN